jgi:copper homeostasis protein CutC
MNSVGGDDHSSNCNSNKSTPSIKRTTKTRSRYVVEVCLSDIQSLMEACQGSCNSIELCVNRLEGGITASYALIEHSVRVIAGINTTNSNDSRSSSSSSSNSNSLNRSIDLHVLIRPRPGGFNYTDDEFDIIQRYICMIRIFVSFQ